MLSQPDSSRYVSKPGSWQDILVHKTDYFRDKDSKIHWLEKVDPVHNYYFYDYEEEYQKRLNSIKVLNQQIIENSRENIFLPTNRNSNKHEAIAEYIETGADVERGVSNLAQMTSSLANYIRLRFDEAEKPLPNYEFIDMMQLLKFGDWINKENWTDGYEKLLTQAFDVNWIAHEYSGSYQGEWYAAFEHEGRICLLNGYYGSCSSSDDLMESDPVDWIKNYMKNVRAFKNPEDAIMWLENTNDFSYKCDYEAVVKIREMLQSRIKKEQVLAKGNNKNEVIAIDGIDHVEEGYGDRIDDIYEDYEDKFY